MAQALIHAVLGEDATVENITLFNGSDLVGMEYEPLFDFQKPLVNKPAWRVVADSYVTMTDGTGIVHQAPAFGEDDARVGRENDLPFLQLVDTRGRMAKETPWAGTFVKDADPLILEDLEKRGLLVKAEEFTHDYPFCWRCDTPLIYYARATWFIRMTAVKEQLLASNRSVNWLPDNIKEGRMGNFLENVIDWGLSRERYWGTPLPVWVCECGHTHVIGSRKELEELGHDVPHDLELHRPYIDQVTITCAGTIPAPCPLPSTTTPLSTRTSSRRRSRPTSSPRPSTRRAAGSIRFWPSPRCCLAARRLKTAWCSATCRTRTARRCPSTRAMS